MTREDEAFIEGVELSIDNGIEMPKEYYELYQYLIQKREEERVVNEATEEMRAIIEKCIEPLTECLQRVVEIINEVLKSEKIRMYAQIVYDIHQEQREKDREG